MLTPEMTAQIFSALSLQQVVRFGASRHESRNSAAGFLFDKIASHYNSSGAEAQNNQDVVDVLGLMKLFARETCVQV